MRIKFFISFFNFLGRIFSRKKKCHKILPKIDTSTSEAIQMTELNVKTPTSPISLTPSEEILYI
jgi:hypothetical protein